MTSVKVYAVAVGGSTAEEVGTGSLVSPQVVVAERELALRLRPLISTVASFRVGLAAQLDDGISVEVIDARELHTGETSEDGDVVALSLSRPSTLPPSDNSWNWCDVLRPRPFFC